jgi:hypothetical protein
MIKKLLLLVAFISVTGISFINAQCTVTPFFVSPDSIADGAMNPTTFRFCVGDIVEDKWVQILPMTEYNYEGAMFDVVNFKLNSFSPPLPAWIDYVCLDPANMFYAGVWTCVQLSIPSAVPAIVPAGKDSVVLKFALNVTALVKAQGTSTEITQSATPSDSITMVVYKRVGGLCRIGINELENNFNVIQSTPNPFVTETTIGFNAAKSGEFELKVYNTLGQVVYTEKLNAGSGNNYFRFTGSELNKGMYLYTVNGQAHKLVKN